MEVHIAGAPSGSSHTHWGSGKNPLMESRRGGEGGWGRVELGKEGHNKVLMEQGGWTRAATGVGEGQGRSRNQVSSSSGSQLLAPNPVPLCMFTQTCTSAFTSADPSRPPPPMLQGLTHGKENRYSIIQRRPPQLPPPPQNAVVSILELLFISRQ